MNSLLLVIKCRSCSLMKYSATVEKKHNWKLGQLRSLIIVHNKFRVNNMICFADIKIINEERLSSCVSFQPWSSLWTGPLVGDGRRESGKKENRRERRDATTPTPFSPWPLHSRPVSPAGACSQANHAGVKNAHLVNSKVIHHYTLYNWIAVATDLFKKLPHLSYMNIHCITNG